MNTQAVLDRALGIWNDKIIDPEVGDDSDQARISKLNISRFIEIGLGKPGYVYTGDGCFQWCGAFAGYCWAAGGLPEAIRKTHGPKDQGRGFASTYKLWNLAEAGEIQRVRPSQIVPGDILVIGDKKQWGDHITLAIEKASEGKIPCVGGNQVGRGPNGKKYQGVTEILVGVLSVRFAYRPQ